MENFTVKQGLAVQKRQLKDWEQLLKSEVFLILKTMVENANIGAKDGYEIVRGNSIDSLLFNVVLRGLNK